MAVATFDSESVYDAAAGGYAEISERLWSWASAGLVAGLRDLPPNASVLDAGCGPGGVSVRLARRLGPGGTVTALDISEEMLVRARENARSWGARNVVLQRGDMTALDGCGLSDSYDAVTAGLSLFLAPDIAAAAAGLWRRVRAGGQLAVSVVAEQFFSPAFDELLAALTEAYGVESLYIPWRRVDHIDSLKAALEQGGIASPEIRVEVRQVPLEHPSDWQAIMLGTGIRSLLDGLDGTARAEVEQGSIEQLASQGLRTLAFGVIYAVAHKPR
jgi:SAM-dependent methyltransferase